MALTDADVDVRPASFEDLPRVAELFTQLGYPAALQELAVRWRDRADAADSVTLVAEAQGGVVGVLVLHWIWPLHVAQRWARISALVVDERVRGAGVGSALRGRAEREAVQAGCARIGLSSHDSRTRAHQFYLRHGVCEVRKRCVKKCAHGSALS